MGRSCLIIVSPFVGGSLIQRWNLGQQQEFEGEKDYGDGGTYNQVPWTSEFNSPYQSPFMQMFPLSSPIFGFGVKGVSPVAVMPQPLVLFELDKPKKILSTLILLALSILGFAILTGMKLNSFGYCSLRMGELVNKARPWLCQQENLNLLLNYY